MSAVLSEILIAAAAVLMFACLCWVMGRGEEDRACPVRPVPPRRPAGGTTWTDPGPVDPDAPWHDPDAVAS